MVECIGRDGKPKHCYKSRQAALGAASSARAYTGKPIEAYKCACGAWHVTSHSHTQKSEVIPSAAKLRRRLENYGREIRAAQRRFEASQAALMAAKACEAQDRAEVERALEAMYSRLRRV
ncbi:MAG: hypothetical protein WAN17_20335 [Candidatus Sulfotelmatobacter sp.]